MRKKRSHFRPTRPKKEGRPPGKFTNATYHRWQKDQQRLNRARRLAGKSLTPGDQARIALAAKRRLTHPGMWLGRQGT